MKKKLLVIVAILFTVLFVTGCGSQSSGKEVKNYEEKNNKGISKVSIAETVLLDRDGIKVTAKSIGNSIYGPEIKVLIENNSNTDITIQARDVSVNGIMIEPAFSADVAAGKKANDTITFLSSDLEVAKITAIQEIELSLIAMDANSWDDIFEQKGIILKTDATDYVQKYNTEGTVVVDRDGIKIYILKLDDKDSFWGADIYVYVENNSSQNVTIQADDVSINGFMVEPAFSVDVNSGKKAYDTISFLESDLNDNDITDINEIELKFDVFNADSWNDIFVTEIKKISFK